MEQQAEGAAAACEAGPSGAPRRVNDLGMYLVDVQRDTGRRQRPQTAASFGTEAGSILLG